jgi:ribosomal protein L21E
MKLVNKQGKEVKPGDTVVSFRGDVEVMKAATPPRHSGSTGRVLTDRGEFYPGVYNLKWVE